MISKTDSNSSGITGFKKELLYLKQNGLLLLMCMPAIVFFFIFGYLLMPGIYVAFVDYQYNLGMFKSAFVGLSNFKFLINSGMLLKLTVNTILYNIGFIVTGIVLQLLISILLNEISSKVFRKVTQTIMIFPHFISFVLLGLLTYNILSFDQGILNRFLIAIGMAPLKIYTTKEYWPFILTLTNLWKGAGYGSIIYFAAITGMDAEILEAANVDGANAWQRILHITLPHLRPTVIILLLFSLGGILRGNFGLFYFLTGASNIALHDSTDIIETFVFRALMTNFNFSSASAVGLYQSTFGFLLVMLVNWIVKKVEPEYSLF